FIYIHFNYHTANYNMQNLDWDSLAHQGSYLLPLLHYFSDADLSDLKSNKDHVYFNFPIVKIIDYPFNWILPMLFFAILAFGGLVVYGLRKKSLRGKAIFLGFLPFLLSLIVSGLTGFFGWKLILKIYPHYNEIQQG